MKIIQITIILSTILYFNACLNKNNFKYINDTQDQFRKTITRDSEVLDSFTIDYFNYLESLVFNNKVEIHITKSDLKYVDLYNEHLLISKGILKDLKYESDLIFILCHEKGHLELNHLSLLTKTTSSEQSADLYAASCINNFGYNLDLNSVIFNKIIKNKYYPNRTKIIKSNLKSNNLHKLTSRNFINLKKIIN